MTKKPGNEDLRAAANRSVPNLVAPGLRILFCGINPSLYSGAVGHHFARPGNRFWPALHVSGLTPCQMKPEDEHRLLELGIGITNLVNRATASAREVPPDELRRGALRLRKQVLDLRPRVLSVLGVQAYRSAFGKPKASLGLQAERIGDTRIWVLPNPSGINAHYQLQDLADWFRELRREAEEG